MTDNPSYSIIYYPSAKCPDGYRAFVFSKWLRSLRYGNALFKKVSASDYYKNYHAFIEKLLKKPDSIIRFAILSDEPDILLGFSVSREDVLDYIYVNFELRRTGIGKMLLPPGATTFTHLTKLGLAIWPANEKYKHLKFNPFA